MTEDQEKYQSDIVKFDSRHSKLPAPEQDNSFFATIERLSARPDIPVEKIKQIMEMQEHILDRNAKQAFNAAMTQAQSKIKAVVARSDNDQTKSKYANLKTVLVEAAPIYTAEGFSLMFYPLESQKESHQRVGVDIMHKQGHTEQRYGDFAIQTTGIGGKSMMTQIHGEGSAFSYGRRYLTCMIFNIPTGDDDDGNLAGVVEFITEAQAKEINDLLKETSADVPKFLKVAKAESVKTISSKMYPMLIKQLKDKKHFQSEKAKEG